MKDYTNANPTFSTSMKITETTDAAHADNVNAAPITAFDNTLALEKEIEEITFDYDEESKTIKVAFG